MTTLYYLAQDEKTPLLLDLKCVEHAKKYERGLRKTLRRTVVKDAGEVRTEFTGRTSEARHRKSLWETSVYFTNFSRSTCQLYQTLDDACHDHVRMVALLLQHQTRRGPRLFGRWDDMVHDVRVVCCDSENIQSYGVPLCGTYQKDPYKKMTASIHESRVISCMGCLTLRSSSP